MVSGESLAKKLLLDTAALYKCIVPGIEGINDVPIDSIKKGQNALPWKMQLKTMKGSGRQTIGSGYFIQQTNSS